MKRSTDKHKAARMARHLREFCLYYHEPRKIAKDRQKVKVYQTKKDGSQSKRYNTFYRCECCGDLFEKVHMDHIVPVGRAPTWPYELDELINYFRKILCPLENWQALCESCHKQKTDRERDEKKQILF